jgi:hypothetical protein
MLSNSQYLKMLLMFTSNLLSHYMVIAFCTLFFLKLYCVICNVGIDISKLLFVKCFIFSFHLSSFTHHNVAKNICRTSKLHFQVFKS